MQFEPDASSARAAEHGRRGGDDAEPARRRTISGMTRRAKIAARASATRLPTPDSAEGEGQKAEGVVHPD